MADISSTQNNRFWLWPVLVSIPIACICAWLLWQIATSKAQGVDSATMQSYTALQQEVQGLQALMQQEPCAISKALNLPPSEEGGTVLGTEPGETSKAEPDPSSDSKAVAALNAKQIESATVLVIGVNNQGDISIGTGFFIAPGLIATNRHVIENSTTNYVTNKVLGGLIPVSVKAVSTSEQRDYAILESKGEIPDGVTILPLDPNLEKTEKVSAWGYPTAISKNDPQFNLLMKGNIQAIPEVIYSEGVVSAILQRTPPLIAHTAQLSQGNSGGPLLNEHGHVVGINTMISLDDDSYRQTSLSLPSVDLLDFLQQAGVNPKTIVGNKASE